MIITISKDFSATPGARYKIEGKYSGEQFRDEMLEPKYLQAKQSGEKLQINLDGGYGYPTSFLEEAFGGLARKYDAKSVLNILEFKSEDEPALVNEIESYIKNCGKERTK